VITNSGGYQATSVELTGYSCAFTQSSTTCTGTINASGGSCTVTVQFAPTSGNGASGSKNFTLNVAYNDGLNAQNATRYIVGKALNASSITASPSPWALGNVVVGSTNDNTITFTNASGDYATATALALQALTNQYIYLGGSVPGTGGTCTTSSTLAAGASCTAVIRYAPSGAATNSTSLTLNFNNGLTTTSAAASISATAKNAALLSFSPTTVNFGTKATGSSTDQSFTVSNPAGYWDASSLVGGTLNAPYSYKTTGVYPGSGGTCGTSLAAGSTCTIVVTYAPTGAGTHSGQSVALTYNNGLNGGQNASASLTGEAVTPASVGISDSAYGFGNKVIGATASTKVFTVSNTGGFTASSVNATVSGHADFTITANTCGTGAGTIAGGATCSVTVQFAPAATGNRSVTLSVSYNDGNTGQTTNNNITGYGLNPSSISVSPTSWPVGSKVAGTVTEQTFTFTNATGDYAAATSLSLAALGNQFRFKGGSAPGTGGTCGDSVTSLAAAASCTAVVEYAPTVAQGDSSTLQLNFNNGVTSTNKTAALTGTGTPAATSAVTASLTAAGNKTAGASFTLNLIAKDAYNNDTDTNCVVETITVNGGTASTTGGGASATNPARPTTMTKTSTGHYTTGNITLYNAEESPSLTVTACGVTSSAVAVTVVPTSLNAIWLDTATPEPASHSATANCGNSASLSCTLYAFGWDQYGNSLPSEATKTSFTCTTWSVTGNTAPDVPNLSSAGSSHSTAATQGTYHIASSVQCAVGAVNNSTVLSGKIWRDYSLSCSKTCGGNFVTAASCTLTNSTGYGGSFTLTPSDGTASAVTGNCTTGAGTCASIALTPSGSASSITVNVLATEADGTIVDLRDPTAPAASLTCP
jgi:hypothetical protein